LARGIGRRDPEAGVTLVEMLVVLALMGVLAGTAALGLGALSRGADPRAEAALLAARMRLASEEAVLAGRPAALLWEEGGYRFASLADGAWAPHPRPALSQPRTLPEGLRLRAEGEARAFAITPAALPAGGEPLRLGLEGRREAVTVLWDGASAQVEAAP
jgi:general secretion pathway protein H